MERGKQFHNLEAHGQGALFPAPPKWNDVAMTGRQMTPRYLQQGRINEGNARIADESSGEYDFSAEREAGRDRYRRVRTEGLPTIRVNTPVLEGMADDMEEGEHPRYKTQFETQHSNGMYDPDHRARYEHQAFGYPKDLPTETQPSVRAYAEGMQPRYRPVYGVMDHPEVGGGDSGSSYGDHKMVLKPEIRDRTTTTWDDSLDYGVPRRLTESEDYEPMEVTGANTGYVEAQFHGGVQAKDIDHLVLNRYLHHRGGDSTRLQSMKRGADKDVDAGIDVAERLGVPWRVKGTQHVGSQMSLFQRHTAESLHPADASLAEHDRDFGEWSNREMLRTLKGDMEAGRQSTPYSIQAEHNKLRYPKQLSRQFTMQKSPGFRSAYDSIEQ